MEKVIEERIDTFNNHRTPSGYRRTKDIGLAPIDWTLGKMSDVITPIKRAVPKPDKPYWRLGIKSWAKGTFHDYVDEPENVDMDELYEVHENDLVVNITFAWEHAIAIANKDDQGLLVSHRFPTYEFKAGQVPNFYKSVISQQFFKDMLKHISPGGAGRNRVLNQKDFLNLPCYVPPIAEQKKISEILAHCDKLIKLCEIKIDEYKRVKKTYLSKMFPKNGSNVPEIRFPGFTGAWEQRKLEDAFDMTISNNTLSRAELNYEGGEVQSVHYGDVLIKYSAFIDAQHDEIPFITGGTKEKYRAQLLQDGDIIFADTAEDETAGKAAEIGDLMGKMVVSGLHTIVCRPYERKAKYYLGYYLNSESFHRQLLPLMQGIKVLSLSRANLSNTIIKYPVSEVEQAQIGNFFRQLDNLITLHQRERYFVF
jgi:restriction endonuclease S subunit